MPTVLITGCDEGIGREFATAYLADGWSVIATYLKLANRLPDAPRLHQYQLDVTDLDQFATVKAALGGAAIDLLIANAAARRRQAPKLVARLQTHTLGADQIRATKLRHGRRPPLHRVQRLPAGPARRHPPTHEQGPPYKSQYRSAGANRLTKSRRAFRRVDASEKRPQCHIFVARPRMAMGPLARSSRKFTPKHPKTTNAHYHERLTSRQRDVPNDRASRPGRP